MTNERVNVTYLVKGNVASHF